MMKMRKSIIAALAMSLLLIGISGCMKQEGGPAERAGKKIDKTVEKGGEQIEKAGKKIQDDAKGKRSDLQSGITSRSVGAAGSNC